MHVSPLAIMPGMSRPDSSQSAKVAHAPHVPLMQACPFEQPIGKLQWGGRHIPPRHSSPGAQSVACEHVHWDVECVAVHVAVGPHWLFVVHAWQVPPAQTSPGRHWTFAVQLGQAVPTHARHAWYGRHMVCAPGGPWPPTGQ
jgi:hypothetical protein